MIRLGIVGWLTGVAVIIATGRIGCYAAERGAAWVVRRLERRRGVAGRVETPRPVRVVGWDGRRIDA